MSTAIEVHNLSKSYPVGVNFWKRRAARHTALVDVELQVNAGEIFGLVGRNGYGKTTLTKCIASLLVPSAGNVVVFGHDTVEAGLEVRKRIGWVGTEERSFYFRLTGRQNLLFFARLQGLSRARTEQMIDRYAEELGVTDLLDRRFHEYSTGNRQRLALMRGLLHEPSLLLLDEPTRSLDPFAATALRTTLETWIQGSPERTIVITSHNLDEIEELSDRVGIMSRGQLRACGPVNELRTQLGASERIGIQLKAVPSNMKQLEERLTDCSFDTSISGQAWLRFTRNIGDESVDATMRQLVEQKASIVSVERTELTLQDIIDHVDKDVQ